MKASGFTLVAGAPRQNDRLTECHPEPSAAKVKDPQNDDQGSLLLELDQPLDSSASRQNDMVDCHPEVERSEREGSMK